MGWRWSSKQEAAEKDRGKKQKKPEAGLSGSARLRLSPRVYLTPRAVTQFENQR